MVGSTQEYILKVINHKIQDDLDRLNETPCGRSEICGVINMDYIKIASSDVDLIESKKNCVL
jgi:hypothetical protein